MHDEESSSAHKTVVSMDPERHASRRSRCLPFRIRTAVIASSLLEGGLRRPNCALLRLDVSPPAPIVLPVHPWASSASPDTHSSPLSTLAHCMPRKPPHLPHFIRLLLNQTLLLSHAFFTPGLSYPSSRQLNDSMYAFITGRSLQLCLLGCVA